MARELSGMLLMLQIVVFAKMAFVVVWTCQWFIGGQFDLEMLHAIVKVVGGFWLWLEHGVMRGAHCSG